MDIRNATPSDAAGIARVHIDSWRHTYEGIVSDEFLAGLDVGARTAYWTRVLDQRCDNVFVALHHETVVGFVSCGKGREVNGYDAEIYALYVLPEYKKRGLGRGLFNSAVRYLVESDHDTMYVVVLAANPAVMFYEYMGGTVLSRGDLAIDRESYPSITLGWKIEGMPEP